MNDKQIWQLAETLRNDFYARNKGYAPEPMKDIPEYRQLRWFNPARLAVAECAKMFGAREG